MWTHLVTVRDFKVFVTDSDKGGSPRYVAAAAMLVVINVVALATISRPYATSGGYLFSSGSIFGSSCIYQPTKLIKLRNKPNSVNQRTGISMTLLSFDV